MMARIHLRLCKTVAQQGARANTVGSHGEVHDLPSLTGIDQACQVTQVEAMILQVKHSYFCLIRLCHSGKLYQNVYHRPFTLQKLHKMLPKP